MTILRYIRAALIFIRHQSWVDEPKWTLEDATDLRDFFATEAGIRFRGTLLNLVLKQQAAAVGADKRLEFECGFASGQRGMAAVIQSMADTDRANPRFTTQEDEGADPAANQ